MVASEKRLSEAWQPSRYNLLVPLADQSGAVFNRRSGACVLLGPQEFGLAQRWLRGDVDLGTSMMTDQATTVATNLVAAGALVEHDADELALVRARYAGALDGSRLLLTIIPTFACNFDCVYCAVPRREGRMSVAVEDRVIDYVKRYFEEHQIRELVLEWYGGEPLCASDVVDHLSRALADLCDERGIAYSTQLITNGSLLDTPTVERFAAWRVSRVQITLDGTREMHNSRRPWRGGGRSSFDSVMTGLERIVGRCDVVVRANIDTQNLADSSSLLQLFDDRGWLRAGSRFTAYPAVVCNFSNSCRWSTKNACDVDEYYSSMTEWLEVLARRGVRSLLEGMFGFPQMRPACCGAVTHHGHIVTPAGLLHRCILEAERDDLATGTLVEGEPAGNRNASFWREYDPFAEPECRDCECLPTCLGGCPRYRRAGRQDLVAQSCQYYRQVEPRLLAAHVRLHAELSRA